MSWKKLSESPNNQVVKKSYDSTITFWKFENGKVWHQWKKLMSADFKSFEIYENNDFIARDKNNVYHAWTKLNKVDRDTFQEVGNSYWKDKNLAFIENETSITPLKGLDSKSFNYIGNGFAFDKDFAYWCGRVIRSCTSPQTLKIVDGSDSLAVDSENVYYESGILKGADVKSWQFLQGGFSRDEKRIFFGSKKLPKVDIETWEHIHRAYSKDKNNVYSMSFIEKDKAPKDWNLEKVIKHYEK
ncbi:DKNYY domain-containing protein [Algibacter sp. TI.3.09]|uniref:DKNYY domain-containing protein n=1 Tax=Algibacter sp. TI.3.09 TaxID=3121298 RepID=UPI00311F1CF7